MKITAKNQKEAVCITELVIEMEEDEKICVEQGPNRSLIYWVPAQRKAKILMVIEERKGGAK